MNDIMKRVGNLMEKICTIDNLLLAYHKAKKGKQQSRSVIVYSENLVENIVRLRGELLSGDVKIGRYHYFTIYDPKLRRICAAAFEERIIHHAIINVCHPYFERHLIYDTYATRLGKGAYAAINRARAAMHKYGYVSKLDMKTYFDSISHDILKLKLRRIFKDEKLLELFDRIIESYEKKPGYGIPIGNLTSQYFANYYLSYLDHYAKEVLKVPVYIRYMDDILVFDTAPIKIREDVYQIRCFIEKELHLRLKQPVFGTTSSGVSFLGYTLYPHKLLLNRRSKIRLKNKMHEYAALYAGNEWTDWEYMSHITPLLAFSQKAYTKGLLRRLCAKIYS